MSTNNIHLLIAEMISKKVSLMVNMLLGVVAPTYVLQVVRPIEPDIM